MASSLSGTSDTFRSTPPPAPSALFAKRARESQLEDRMSSSTRYRPPALRTINAGDSPPPGTADTPTSSTVDSLPPTNFPPGFRRARAGTLPSNVQLAAAQRFGATLQSNQSSLDFSVDAYNLSSPDGRMAIPTPPSSASLASNIPQRPGLKHSASIATSGGTSVINERNSRLRSGSLTLPPTGLSNGPFGPSLFSSPSWSNNGRGSVFPALEEYRSALAAESGHDEFDVHTLDYLGLDDNLGGRTNPTPATVTELRAQAQAALTGSLSSNPARNRATTVSNPYRLMAGLQGSASGTLSGDELLMEEFNDIPIGSNGRSMIDAYEPGASVVHSNVMSQAYRDNQLMGSAAGANTAGRARASTMGNIDDHTRLMNMRRGYEDDAYDSELAPSASMGYAPPVSGSILKDGRSVRSNGVSPGVRFPSEATPSRTVNFGVIQARPPSPKGEPATQVQTPSRSLWIGNLDSTFTSEDLIRVFAPYGAIESLRLLPEKECGFVNFVDQSDAIRAKDDVLNRLGGMIGMANGQAVRVGFGKPDSAPVAPAKATAVVTPQGLATPGGATHLKSPGANSPGGMEQVQSTPTRALWIGSIPSTTTPASILSVFSPFGPIESARVLTHKNCGFINFERLDDAVRARKALNGRDVLGSDVGAIRIGFARVPTKNSNGEVVTPDETSAVSVQGIGDLSVSATINALRNIQGASTISADQQVLSGNVENYRSNLVLSMVTSGDAEALSESLLGKPITEQQMVMKALSAGSPESDADVQALSDFRPPTMYYTSIPLVSERSHNKRWDASKLRELRKRLDSGGMSVQDIDDIASDFLDGEIVDLASDWLGNTVVQKLFEKCTPGPRFAMLERLAPYLAMIGIHKNGTWAAQKIIECISTPEEISLVTQHLRAYTPPLLLDQFGNYVVQCCLRFGSPDNDFVFDAMIDRLWEIAQGRFGARSMRACLESNHITLSQQRRLATAVILNSIPLATNPNGALLLTWLLDSSNFPSRYSLLAPRFTPHLSHLCTHKLASLTVLRLVNQKVEPSASSQVVEGLFMSTNDHVLTDVLGDQVNGVTVVHKVLTSPFLSSAQRDMCVEATKRVLTELKVIATQAYRRLIEEVGMPIQNYQVNYGNPGNSSSFIKGKGPAGYPAAQSPSDLAPLMANLQMQGMNPSPTSYSPHGANPHMFMAPNYPNQGGERGNRNRPGGQPPSFSPSSDPFNPFNLRSPEMTPLSISRHEQLHDVHHGSISPPPMLPMQYSAQSPSLAQAGNMLGMNQAGYGMPPNVLPPHVYQAYYQMYQQQNPQNVGSFQ